MAIKKKETVESRSHVPEQIDRLLQKGFTEQFLKDMYDDMFSSTKKEVLAEIKKSDEIEITQGEGFRCDYGSIILSERSSYAYDKDALAELVHSGKLTVEQLLGFVSTFKAEDAIKTLSQKVFDTVAKKTVTDTFTFKATSDFKAECEEKFAHDGLDATDERSESARMADEMEALVAAAPKAKAKKAAPTPILDSMKEESAKRLASKITSKKAAKALEDLSVDDEIDAILKG
jgi:hypothetical protein